MEYNRCCLYFCQEIHPCDPWLAHESSYLLIYIVPTNIRLKYFGSDFEKIYRGRLPSTFTCLPLPALLEQTKNVSSKCILLLVTPSRAHPDILAFMSRQDLIKPLNRNFLFTGHTANHQELTRLNQLDAP